MQFDQSELAEGEAQLGCGFTFEAALCEFVSEIEWKAQARSPFLAAADESLCRQLVLERKWRAREVVCYGFPRDKPTGRRELVSAALIDEHLYFSRGGAVSFNWTSEDPAERQRGIAYSEVRFYPATGRTSQKTAAYGERQRDAKQWIAANHDKLDGLSVNAQARLIAQETGCSPSTAKNALKDERQPGGQLSS